MVTYHQDCWLRT